MMALPAGIRWRTGIASLSTGVEQGVEGQLLGVAWRRPSGLTVGVSVARSAVTGLVRTDTDPQSLGDIPYQSLLGSVTVAREVLPWLTAGVAARLRHGQVETDRRQALAADLGVLLHPGRWQDLRLAMGTFLWRPGREPEDRPLVTAAGDVRVLGSSPEAEVRVGLAAQGSTRGLQERTTGEFGPVLSGRFGLVEARAALPTLRSGDVRVTRVRFSLGLHLSRFVVGLAREDANVGFAPLYQFTFSAFGS
jgi:hypothetical protein